MSKPPVNLCHFKKILSFVRGADYAHAGEEAAIDLVFDTLSKSKDQRLLDVGCGLGGTANYIEKKGWGKVVGFDIDAETIAAAKAKYPNIEFHVCDVLNASKCINEQFDIIYLFNVLYAIPQEAKIQALTELRKLATHATQLVIFDYTELAKDIACKSYNTKGRYFIQLENIKQQLGAAGWKLIVRKNLDVEYKNWYTDFLHKIVAKKEQIIAMSDAATYQLVHDIYAEYLTNIKNKKIGGVLLFCLPA